MDRMQAAELQRHLLEAADAIKRASDIILSLDSNDRATLVAPVDKISSAIHFELLYQAIYAQHPDLRWEVDETSAVNTVRRWEEVVLPDGLSVADIDAIIFSSLKADWRKTALLVGTVLTECERIQLPVSDEMIGARIQALNEEDRLESQGDLRKWRFSEVRLKS